MRMQKVWTRVVPRHQRPMRAIVVTWLAASVAASDAGLNGLPVDDIADLARETPHKAFNKTKEWSIPKCLKMPKRTVKPFALPALACDTTIYTARAELAKLRRAPVPAPVTPFDLIRERLMAPFAPLPGARSGGAHRRALAAQLAAAQLAAAAVNV